MSLTCECQMQNQINAPAPRRLRISFTSCYNSPLNFAKFDVYSYLYLQLSRRSTALDLFGYATVNGARALGLNAGQIAKGGHSWCPKLSH